MSHVKAYRCDYCSNIVEEEAVVGLIASEDLFDRLRSFPTVFTPVAVSKCEIHYCTDCYRVNVSVPSEREINRYKDEEGYKKKLEEVSFAFRQSVVHRVRLIRSKKK